MAPTLFIESERRVEFLRFIQVQHSIIGQAVLAYYYPWSILSVRGLIEMGIGWRIGMGNSVNIWNNAWIPGLGNRKIQCQNTVL
ncbi:hypothetical protein EPI10_024843 [Gossypium australe]|uniref:Uncharacterized protein n=1 Tax=Gossypium australe TaxID=47621 RepID=A0A5B6VZQ9_9ROSI|nr:hypothetical protein EPI10_024843 [Gossypium australe]